MGGVLTLVRPEVELIVTAADIPESIVIDVSALEIGDNLTINDVKLPEGAKPTIDRDFVIAQVSAPSGLASQSDDDEEDVAADEVPTTEMDPPNGEQADD
jgi:large subunit ribosomal protein L25